MQPECHVYFAARPRHILCAAAIALDRGHGDHRLFVVDRLTSADRQAYVEVLGTWRQSPFTSVVWLPSDVEDARSWWSRCWRRPRAFWQQLANRATIRRELSARPPNRVHVALDTLFEMQCALHWAHVLRPDVRCVYVEDGSAAYAKALPRPRRRLARLRRIAKFTWRRLLSGGFRRHVEMPGTSPWIDEAVVAFPQLVIDRLRHLTLRAMPSAPFAGPELAELASHFARRLGAGSCLQGVDVLIALASSSTAKRLPGYSEAMAGLCRALVAAGRRVVVKHHPRETEPGFVPLPAAPTLAVAPAAMPFELLLILLEDPAITVIGDISSALIATRQQLPAARILALRHGTATDGYMGAFEPLGIRVCDDVGAVLAHVSAPA